MTVLVTEPNHKNSLAVCRALVASGLRVVTMGRRFSQTNYSRYNSKSFNFRWERHGFLESVVQIASLTDATTLIPVGARSVFASHKYRELLSEKINFAIAPPPSLLLSKNKADLFQFAREIGLDVPESERFSDYEALVRSLRTFPLPFVVKSSSELSKFKPFYVRNKDDLERVLREDLFSGPIAEGELVLQRLISGPGQGFFALYQNQHCKRVMMHERLRETPETGGSSWAAKSIYSAPLFESGKLLLDALDWHGPAMVEFKVYLTNGIPYLIELNPKLWGSLDLTIASGVNIPLDLVNIASGTELKPDFMFERGIHFYWPLDSVKSLLGRKDLGKEEFLTNIKVADFLPHVIQLVQTVFLAAKNKLKTRTLFRFLYWVKTKGWRAGFDRFVGEILGIPTKGACQINDFLWVGAQPGALGRHTLRFWKRTDIVSLVSTPLSDDYSMRFSVHTMPVTEFVSIPPEILLTYTNQLMDMEKSGKKIFLHCREGVGRAPTIAAAFMIRNGMNVGEAIKQIMSGRRPTSLTEHQLDSLNQFYNFLRSRPSSNGTGG